MQPALDPNATQPGEPLATHEVRGGGGLRLHVREWGFAQGPPIVFVHGWSQSQLCWSHQISGALAADFRLITFDLRGHGIPGGHFLPEEAPAQTLAALAAFFAEGLRG